MAAMFKIVHLLIEFQEKQTEYRHKLRDDLTSIVLNAETRVTRRLERLETTSIGFRRARLQQEAPDSGK